MKKLLTLKKLTCLRCAWTWTPRVADVRCCPNPKCRSRHWDQVRVEKKEEAAP